MANNNNSAKHEKNDSKNRLEKGHSGSTRNLLHPPSDVLEKIRENRASRYELQASARALLLWAGKLEGLEHPQNFHRTSKCMHITISQVGINKSLAFSQAFYSGLMICGSVWACPICTAKIQERRRVEIASAVEYAYKNSMQTAMLTLTFPHYFNDELEVLIKKQAKALALFRAGKAWTKFKERSGFAGLIRALELTYGTNGWHPHTHELWLLDSDFSANDEREFIVKRWLNCCIKAELVDANNSDQIAAFMQHSVDIKDRCDASDYLAKNDAEGHWGVDRELSKAATKAGRAAGLHAFGLLALYKDGDEVAGQKFLEFCKTMKGKRQLFWSHGLKKTVGIEELTDEEIAEKKEDKADLLGLLTAEQWVLVRNAGLRSKLLDLAELGGFAAVTALLLKLEQQT